MAEGAVTASAVTAGAPMVTLREPASPLYLAEMIELPAVRPLSTPDELIDATAGFEVLQVTDEVTSEIIPIVFVSVA